MKRNPIAKALRTRTARPKKGRGAYTRKGRKA